MLTTALASSGTTVGVQQYFSTPADVRHKELVNSVHELSRGFHRLTTDPTARPGAWTSAMAAVSHAAISERHRQDIKGVREALRKLRDRIAEIEGALREDNLREKLDHEFFTGLEDMVSEHERRLDAHEFQQEHIGADRRMTEHDRRLDVLEKKLGQ